MRYKEEAIIVDVDGTLAHRVDRSPFDFEKVDTDTYDTVIGEIVDTFAKLMNIICNFISFGHSVYRY